MGSFLFHAKLTIIMGHKSFYFIRRSILLIVFIGNISFYIHEKPSIFMQNILFILFVCKVYYSFYSWRNIPFYIHGNHSWEAFYVYVKHTISMENMLLILFMRNLPYYIHGNHSCKAFCIHAKHTNIMRNTTWSII